MNFSRSHNQVYSQFSHTIVLDSYRKLLKRMLPEIDKCLTQQLARISYTQCSTTLVANILRQRPKNIQSLPQSSCQIFLREKTSAEWGSQTLKQACYREDPESAMCVQNFNDSRGLAIRITYRISLRSSSLWEPRHPPLKVVLDYSFRVLASCCKQSLPD